MNDTKKQQTGLELRKNNLELKEKSSGEAKALKVVEGIIETFYLDTGRNELDKDRITKMAESWLLHFMNVKLPLGRLKEIYYKAFNALEASQKNFLNVGHITEMWKQIRQEEFAKKLNACQICKGTKKVLVFNFKTKVDEEQLCDCAY